MKQSLIILAATQAFAPPALKGTDIWQQRATENGTPSSGRFGHTAVWTGAEIIIWGGKPNHSGNTLNTGGRYNPATNSWTAVSTTGAPSARYDHTAVWTGTEMIIWGGANYNGFFYALNDGGRYNPETNSWTTVSAVGAPVARGRHTAVWSGSDMIVWGGYDRNFNFFGTGNRYNPETNSWTSVNTGGAPAPGVQTAVWTGSEIIVSGGYRPVAPFYANDTFSYTPVGTAAISISGAALVSGNLLVSFPTVNGLNYTLWRTDTLSPGGWTNTGLTALPGTGAPLNFTVLTTTPSSRFFRVQSAP